ncbi:MAG TPA: class I SAM-dependent methyltransferase, partial [Verrucomicrobiae bacterium]
VIARNAASVTATDFNEEVLTIARAKRLPPGRVKFLQADAYALPAFNESFDTGLAAFWWSHLPKSRLRSFLAGFHGALRPGARVVFIDNSYVEGSSTPIARRDAEGNTYQQRRLNDGSEHEVLKNFPTAEDLRAVVAGMAACVTVELLAYFWLLRYEVRHS